MSVAEDSDRADGFAPIEAADDSSMEVGDGRVGIRERLALGASHNASGRRWVEMTNSRDMLFSLRYVMSERCCERLSDSESQSLHDRVFRLPKG